ncbi:MAG TPA: co-chaperone GroES [Bacteroidales bacterium]|jgi:chaperonin GroES|nr:co-chaperone GroES [Bacteroidales bacterium]
MKIQPLGDRVLIKPLAAEEKTAGGIIIPDTAKQKPLKGQVVAVGNGIDGKALTVKVNDIVLYGKFVGTELNLEGMDYLIMQESEILAII